MEMDGVIKILLLHSHFYTVGDGMSNMCTHADERHAMQAYLMLHLNEDQTAIMHHVKLNAPLRFENCAHP